MRMVEVVPYQAAWPTMFERLSAPLRRQLNGLIVAVHHVGSTAVEGLAAKPIIDIDVEMPDEGDFSAVVDSLASFGYVHVGDQGVVGREAFKRHGPTPMAHHLYVCRSGSDELKRHLVFRDHLRTHRGDRDAYAAVKREAASRFPHDIDGYLAHKGKIIQSIYVKCGLVPEEGML